MQHGLSVESFEKDIRHWLSTLAPLEARIGTGEVHSLWLRGCRQLADSPEILPRVKWRVLVAMLGEQMELQNAFPGALLDDEWRGVWLVLADDLALRQMRALAGLANVIWLEELPSNMLAANRLAAWLFTQLSLTRNRRLARALATDPDGSRAALLRDLPGAVAIAVAERPHHAPLLPPGWLRLDIVARVAALLEADQPCGVGGLPDAPAPAEELRIEARAEMAALVSQAELSDREAEVLALLLEDLDAPSIGKRLGLAPATVRVLKRRSLAKLRRCALPA